MLYYCHNCKVSISFGNFLKSQNAALYDEYCVERYKDSSVNGRDAHKELPEKKKVVIIPKEEISLPSILSLDDNHPAKKILLDRKIPRKYLMDLFYAEDFKSWAVKTFPDGNHKSLHENEARIVIPFYTRKGKIFAAQGRAIDPNNKIRYITIKANDELPLVYGLDRWNPALTTYVVEGPFDSLFLPNCLAVGGSDLSGMISKLQNLTKIEIPELVYVHDNEPRNKQIIAMIQKSIQSGNGVVVWPDQIPQKDLNDMVLAGVDINKTIEDRIFKGMAAELELSNWKKV